MNKLLRYLQSFSTPEAVFVAGLYGLLLCFFSLLRLFLFLRNHDIGQNVPAETLLHSFFVGLRFDLAISSYLLIPHVFSLAFSAAPRKKAGADCFQSICGVSTFYGIV